MRILHYGFDVYYLKFSFSEKASKCQNREEDCTNFCGLLRKAELYCVKPFYFSQITNKVAATIVCYAIAMTNTQNWSTFVQKTNLGKSPEISQIYKIWYFVTKIVLIYCEKKLF